MDRQTRAKFKILTNTFNKPISRLAAYTLANMGNHLTYNLYNFLLILCMPRMPAVIHILLFMENI